MSTSTMLAPTAPDAVRMVDRPRSTFGRMTPVFLVDRVEPSLEFWVDRLGFEVTLGVSGDEGYDFVQLTRDDVQVSYRTRASVERLSPGMLDAADDHQPWLILYLPVSDIDELCPRLEGLEVVVPLRESDFGIREIYVREPSGRIVALVEQAA